ncbi:MAG: hypothetical protein ACREMC_07885, partial [Gemmatimonadales bacterium]
MIPMVREWVQLAGVVLCTGLVVAMIVSGLRASARRRHVGRPALLTGGAPQPAEPHAPSLRSYADARTDAGHGDEDPPLYRPLAPHARPVTPWKRSRRQRASECAAEDLQQMGYEPIPHEEPKIARWDDGMVL